MSEQNIIVNEEQKQEDNDNINDQSTQDANSVKHNVSCDGSWIDYVTIDQYKALCADIEKLQFEQYKLQCRMNLQQLTNINMVIFAALLFMLGICI